VASTQTLVVAAPAGETDVGEFQVTVNELTPVSEPLYAVA
jgi:hypothetical protein